MLSKMTISRLGDRGRERMTICPLTRCRVPAKWILSRVAAARYKDYSVVKARSIAALPGISHVRSLYAGCSLNKLVIGLICGQGYINHTHSQYRRELLLSKFQ